MTKTELVNEIYSKAGLRSKADAERALGVMLESMGCALEAGDKIMLQNFGSFQVMERSERAGRNPRTGEAITIPAKKSIAFRPSKSLVEKLNA